MQFKQYLKGTFSHLTSLYSEWMDIKWSACLSVCVRYMMPQLFINVLWKSCQWQKQYSSVSHLPHHLTDTSSVCSTGSLKSGTQPKVKRGAISGGAYFPQGKLSVLPLLFCICASLFPEFFLFYTTRSCVLLPYQLGTGKWLNCNNTLSKLVNLINLSSLLFHWYIIVYMYCICRDECNKIHLN